MDEMDDQRLARPVRRRFDVREETRRRAERSAPQDLGGDDPPRARLPL